MKRLDKLSVLAVEDDPELLRLLRRVLLDLGARRLYTVRTTLDAERRMLRDRVGLVVTCHRPPAIDGVMLARSLRASAASRDAAMVMVAPDPSRALVVDALAAGVDEFLAGPVSIAALDRKMALALARRRAAAPPRDAEPLDDPPPDDDAFELAI